MKRTLHIVGTGTTTDVDMTAEEVAQVNADVEATRVRKEAREAEEAQTAIDKASAKAKLIAGEALTEAEAATIVI